MRNHRYGSPAGLMSCLLSWGFAGFLPAAHAADDAWKAAMIADALTAAPPLVTGHAKIYAWTDQGEMTLVRDGDGPYTCVASGAFSLRLGKPALPFPDPMCMDQNSWAFLSAVWAEKDPLHPARPYPSTPGMVWMLAGMSVQGGVVLGKSEQAVVKVTDSGKTFQMTPHIMIMPLPFKKTESGLATKYDIDNPLGAWIMAANTPYEHLMVHFSPDDVKAMMDSGQ